MTTAAGQRLLPTQRQTLALTPGLRQALQVLQMTGIEVSDFVARKLDENPWLERAGPGPSGTAGEIWERLPAPAPSLQSHLLDLMTNRLADERERRFALCLIESLDAAGYLERPLAEIAQESDLSPERAAALLHDLQALAPAGVGARDLAECLALQLAHEGALDEAWRHLLRHLPLLAAGRLDELAARTGLGRDELERRLRRLRQLDPKPGLAFEPPTVEAVVPELLLREMPDGGFDVEINPAVAPRLALDRGYRQALGGGARQAEARGFLKARRQEALWLLQALQEREATLLAVGRELVSRQADFLRHGPLALRPLTLKAVAASLGLAESTVSRVTARNHLGRDSGTVALRRFFSGRLGQGGVSNAAARERLRQLLREPAPAGGWSDGALARRLTDEGYPVARRTVNKYRNSLTKRPPSPT